MDTTFSPGVDNAVMTVRDANGNVRCAMPTACRSARSHVSAARRQRHPASRQRQPDHHGHLEARSRARSAPDQQHFLTVEIQPNSLVNNGQPVASGQVGISVVPPELVRDMLPPGLLQHTFDITVQAPGIANFSTPAPMTFPNVFRARRGRS